MEAAVSMENAASDAPAMSDEDSKTLSFSSNSVKLNSGGNATVKLEGNVKTVPENNEEKKTTIRQLPSGIRIRMYRQSLLSAGWYVLRVQRQDRTMCLRQEPIR